MRKRGAAPQVVLAKDHQAPQPLGDHVAVVDCGKGAGHKLRRKGAENGGGVGAAACKRKSLRIQVGGEDTDRELL